MLIERALPKIGSGVGPGGRGYPFLSMRLRMNRRIVFTAMIMSEISTACWVVEVGHTIVGVSSGNECKALYVPI